MNIKKCLENIIENYKKMNLSKLILIFLFLGFMIGESISSKKPPLNKGGFFVPKKARNLLV